ncbi:hypothetical protein Agub_g13706 [Astrephomene gubernaculifera]|uniref:DNA repair protein RecN n=1 Tax=Astrephomene gubernaculifera TaxID=47775 RepID=A0AAD3E0V3_9CHLO|nr:hypothetical protein Agub_g13706 [Astrephomene gubernaculifera]
MTPPLLSLHTPVTTRSRPSPAVATPTRTSAVIRTCTTAASSSSSSSSSSSAACCSGRCAGAGGWSLRRGVVVVGTGAAAAGFPSPRLGNQQHQPQQQQQQVLPCGRVTAAGVAAAAAAAATATAAAASTGSPTEAEVQQQQPWPFQQLLDSDSRAMQQQHQPPTQQALLPLSAPDGLLAAAPPPPSPRPPPLPHSPTQHAPQHQHQPHQPHQQHHQRPHQLHTHLQRLTIRDFALVCEQEVQFGPGLNVVTGESGSGKSVLVEALSQLLGAPAPPECVRSPAPHALLEGCFLLGRQQQQAVRRLLEGLGLPQRALPPPLSPLQEGEGGAAAAGAAAAAAAAGAVVEEEGFRLVIRREISPVPGGPGLRSRVFLNGCPTSLRVLRELGAALVDANGQHASAGLREPDLQLALLDRIAGTGPLADSYCSLLGRLRAVEGRLDELDELDDEEERGRMQKLVDAVAKLRVQAGEERELRRALKKMEARRAAVEQCGLVRLALSGEGGGGGVGDALRTVEGQLNNILAQEEAEQQQQQAQQGQHSRGKGAAGSSRRGEAEEEEEEGTAGEGEDGEEGDDDDEEEEEDGEGGGCSEGVRLMESALDQLASARDMLAAAEGAVRAYARRFQFSPAEHEAAAERLGRLERLIKQASAAGFGAYILQPGEEGARGGGGSSSSGRGGVLAGGVGSRVWGRGAGGGGRISNTEELLAAAEGCSTRLAAYYEMEGHREEWEAELDDLVPQLRSTALHLSRRRRAAAARLRVAVESCLRDLAMGGSRFDVRIGWQAETPATSATPAVVAAEGLYVSEEEAEEAGVGERGGETYVMGSRGLDVVEFLLAAGPAEPLRPLAAVASGGESARVMLALKAAPAQAVSAVEGDEEDADADVDQATSGTTSSASSGSASLSAGVSSSSSSSSSGGNVPIMILDELDSSIGARLGSAVGSILARMTLGPHGCNSQIICVTHLPQVACYAAHHIKVQKEQQQPLPAAAATAVTTIAPAEHLGTAGSPNSSSSCSCSNNGNGNGNGSGNGVAAADPSLRVATTFQRLEGFEERCEEVAAMLGLDTSVAADLLRTAQSYVASLYPTGGAPEGVLRLLPAPQSGQQPLPQRAPAASVGTATAAAAGTTTTTVATPSAEPAAAGG